MQKIIAYGFCLSDRILPKDIVHKNCKMHYKKLQKDKSNIVTLDVVYYDGADYIYNKKCAACNKLIKE